MHGTKYNRLSSTDETILRSISPLARVRPLKNNGDEALVAENAQQETWEKKLEKFTSEKRNGGSRTVVGPDSRKVCCKT